MTVTPSCITPVLYSTVTLYFSLWYLILCYQQELRGFDKRKWFTSVGGGASGETTQSDTSSATQGVHNIHHKNSTRDELNPLVADWLHARLNITICRFLGLICQGNILIHVSLALLTSDFQKWRIYLSILIKFWDCLASVVAMFVLQLPALWKAVSRGEFKCRAVRLGYKGIRLVPNRTNPKLIQIRYQFIFVLARWAKIY